MRYSKAGRVRGFAVGHPDYLTPESRKAQSESLRRAYAEGKRKRGHSEATKALIAEKGKGRRHTDEAKAKIAAAVRARVADGSHNFQRLTSEERRRAAANRKPGWAHGERWRAAMRKNSGPNSSAWKGGVTPLAQALRNHPRMKEWRAAALRRDGYKCTRCGAREHLVVHHKQSLARLLQDLREADQLNFDSALNFGPLWDVDNGVTLCSQCHHKVDPSLVKLHARSQE